jgi:pimeloyl-ACP methyl ester carboxylesterase
VPTTSHVASTDGVTLALHDLGGEGPDLLLCHPTGFHGRAWAPVAAGLAGRAHSWAVDFRGHGDSTAPASGTYDWHGMADDVLAVVDHLGLGPGQLLGVGHSMGGAALLLAEQARPDTAAALWCYEPIVFPPLEGGGGPGNPLAAAARRRKAWFPSHEAARANYAAKPPLGAFRADALDAYVDFGLRDAPGGGVELKCAPEVEAAVFEMGGRHGGFARLGEVGCPVTIVGSGDGSPPAQMAALIAGALPHGRFVRLAQLTHFGPMEDPAAVAAAIAADLLAS